jgi:hypothetical protein
MGDEQEAVIPKGTILYTGGFTELPTDSKFYHFFSTKKTVAESFAKSKRVPTVLTFRTKQDIKVHVQGPPYDTYFFHCAEEYACPDAQALCQNGFHGYASRVGGELEDIGLCNARVLLEKVPTGGRRSRTLRRKKRKTKKRRI